MIKSLRLKESGVAINVLLISTAYEISTASKPSDERSKMKTELGKTVESVKN